MNGLDQPLDQKRRLIHPAMGWVTMTLSTYEGIIKQEVTQHEVDKLKEKIDKNPLQAMAMRLGDNPQPQMVNIADIINPRTVTEDEIREALAEQFCQFECGIVEEIGPLPPGFPEPEYQAGHKVFFHEGAGLDLGGIRLMMIDKIIGWTDE